MSRHPAGKGHRPEEWQTTMNPYETKHDCSESNCPEKTWRMSSKPLARETGSPWYHGQEGSWLMTHKGAFYLSYRKADREKLADILNGTDT